MRRQKLLYVATTQGIFILSYPGAKHLATITSYSSEPTVCSDSSNGDVFVVSDSTIREYKHGRTNPIATLSPPSGYAALGGCAVDAGTGDLAVTASDVPSGYGAVLVFKGAQGTPTAYVDPKMRSYYYCAYDNSGKLFVEGNEPVKRGFQLLIAELPQGGSAFTDVKLKERVDAGFKIQWDGAYLTVREKDTVPAGIYQISIAESKGTIAGTTQLSQGGDPYWIEGKTVIDEFGPPLKHNDQRVGYWHYPAGGQAFKTFGGLMNGRRHVFSDLTISI